MNDLFLLSAIIFTPTVGALILGLFNAKSESAMRSFANFVTLLTFMLTLFAWFRWLGWFFPGDLSEAARHFKRQNTGGDVVLAIDREAINQVWGKLLPLRRKIADLETENGKLKADLAALQQARECPEGAPGGVGGLELGEPPAQHLRDGVAEDVLPGGAQGDEPPLAIELADQVV